MNIKRLCELFKVNRSSYYNGIKEKTINAQKVALQALVKQLFNESKGSAGARTISHRATTQHGVKLSRYKAGKLMKELGLQSRQHKHKYRNRDQQDMVYDNVLARQFSPAEPNKVWAGDVTYIRIKSGWCYLAVVIDFFSRRVVGFSVSDTPDSALTAKALRLAYQSRACPHGVMFHSDQGTHYTSKAYAKAVAQCEDMQHSMSRRGNCWDNAPTERFFRSFKSEWMPTNGYDSQQQALSDINDYILGYYNRKRPHRHNGYLTPNDAERQFFKQNLLKCA